MNFEVAFTQVTCDKCGTPKAWSTPCAQCGTSTDGDDPLVLQRRRLADKLLPALTTDTTQGGPSSRSVFEAWSVIRDLWNRIEFNLGQIARPNSAGATPSDLATDLMRLRAEVQSTPKLRPWIAMWRLVSQMLDQYREIYILFLQALSAPTPEEAVAISAPAQQIMDQMASAIADLNAKLERWEGISEAPVDGDGGPILQALAQNTFRHAGADDLLDLAAKGATETFRRISGVDTAPLEIGAGLQIAAIQVELLLDSERFWATARSVYEAIMAKRDSVHSVVAHPRFAESFRRSTQEMYELGLEAAALSSVIGNPKMFPRMAIRVGGTVVERVAKPLLAILVAITSGRDYGRLTTRDPNQLTKETRDMGFGSLLYGFDIALRDGDAHSTYVVSESGVRFTSNRREYDFLSFDELLDHSLGALESALAVHTGLSCALAVLGHPVAAPDPLNELGLKPSTVVSVLLSLNGLYRINIKDDPGHLTVSANSMGPLKPSRFVRLAYMVVPYIPHEYGAMTVRLMHPVGVQTASGSLEPCRRMHSAPQGAEKEDALIESLSLWRLDGRPVLSPSLRRKWFAHSTSVALQWLPPVAERRVEQLLSLARRLQDTELEQAMTVLNASSARQDRASAVPRYLALQKLIKWGSRQTEPLE